MDKTLEQIRSYAEQGRYKRVPISKELYADAFTPISVMRTLRAASKHCYLLESAEDRQQWKIFLPWICTDDGDYLYRWACDHQRRA